MISGPGGRSEVVPPDLGRELLLTASIPARWEIFLRIRSRRKCLAICAAKVFVLFVLA
jgi:hypothetical protein